MGCECVCGWVGIHVPHMLLYQLCVSLDVECWHPGSFTCGTRVLPVLPAADVCLLPLLNSSWTPLSLCRSVWKPTSKILHTIFFSPPHTGTSPPLTLHTGTSPTPLPPHTATSPSSHHRALVLVPYNTCRLSALVLASPPPPPSPSPQAHHHPSTTGRPIGTPWLRWSHTPLRTEPLVLPPNLPPW